MNENELGGVERLHRAMDIDYIRRHGDVLLFIDVAFEGLENIITCPECQRQALIMKNEEGTMYIHEGRGTITKGKRLIIPIDACYYGLADPLSGEFVISEDE